MEDKSKEYLGRQDLLIEGSVATWDMPAINGDIAGTYTGQFKFRCYLTPTQRLAAGRAYRELLGSNPTLATDTDDNLAFSLTQLKYRVISAPPFWTANGEPGDVPDETVIDAVLEAAIASELKFKGQLRQKKIEALERAKKAAEKMLKTRDELDAQDKEDEDESSD